MRISTRRTFLRDERRSINRRSDIFRRNEAEILNERKGTLIYVIGDLILATV